jgi:putative ABC transport system substrate-binding protein
MIARLTIHAPVQSDSLQRYDELPKPGWTMKRREFLGMLGGAASWPFAAHAQQGAEIKRLGVLSATAENDPETLIRFRLFRQGLQELGWVEGSNLRIEYRFAAGDVSRMRSQAEELVALKPDLILAQGTPVVAALKRATSTIPTVFVIVNDPVAQGFVSNMARPGGNITGFSNIDYSVIGKVAELLKQLAPAISRVGFLFNPMTYPYYETNLDALRAVTLRSRLEFTAVRIRSEAEIEGAVGKLTGADSGLICSSDPFTFVHRARIASAALQNRIPSAYFGRQWAAAGGLMAYGPDFTDIFRRSVPYVDRVLKGAHPGDLPVQAPTKFDFVINLKTAKSLGLEISATLLALTNEVIE